ncbi:MAG: excinuclease ABC subunit UvrA [Candidatus Woesearchaeota archaeon]
MLKDLIVKGAREHNLKNITVTIPRNKLTVITGLSGSGKSSLAFDTIYAEGQRRYVESLSAYARQFLGLMNKPDLDSIEGLSPAISIEQKTTSKNPRSTVGTVTEIYDYLRLLFARIGIAHCPKCNSKLKPQSAENIVNLLLSKEEEIIILAPLVRGLKGTYEKLLEDIKKEGYSRIRVDGKIKRVDDIESLNLERYEKHWIEIVIDKVKTNTENKARLNEAVEHGLEKGNGTIIVINKDTPASFKEIERSKYETIYSSFGACPNHPEIVFEELEPRMFSFNSPFGACNTCHGIGESLEVSEELVLDKKKSILDGAIKVYGKFDLKWRAQQIEVVGRHYGFDLFTPLTNFTNEQIEVLLYGTNRPLKGSWHTGAKMNLKDGFEGVIPQTMRLYSSTESQSRKDFYEKFMESKPCKKCNGKRLKENMLNVKIKDKSIIDVTDMSITKSKEFFEELPKHLDDKEKFIAKQVLKEINDRLMFLYNVGLDYLTLSRTARTLSGGEAQRIRLATQIGANLMGVLYVLDEPSIGLHQRDNEKLINTLKRLRDLGNTLIVVEHDEETMLEADHIIDIGPGAGVHGGYITAQGTLEDIKKNKKSITSKYLSGEIKIESPKKYREPKSFIEIKGAKENNLKNVDAKLPTKVLCSITGVSGSGKSTLLNQTLIPAIKRKFSSTNIRVGKYESIHIPEEVKGVIVIDQEPIGRTPRSNPATYTKLFDDIRTLFSKTKQAKEKGYGPGRFSFNVKGGRCETCNGDGQIKIEMNFLPDVYVKCDECKGKRYNSETLKVNYKGKNIADVLDMSVEEALKFFENHTGMKRKLQTLFDVGLGYIKLGQSSVTLSGGESQRIKLTRELAKVKKGNTLYLLDEPTTGLHFEDVRKLIEVLNRLVAKGNTIYVIEHNLDVVKSSDYIIDLGPEGGDRGGEIIATGTPKEISENSKSITGKFLKKML